MDVKVTTLDGGDAGSVTLSDAIFGLEPRADLIARKIREVASEHGIPVVENAPLARAIHATVEIDQEIKPEHYKAVAEVIGYIMRLNRMFAGRRS